jgi:glucokinase
MLLAGDVGGTKTLLGLFERQDPRPVPLAIHSYATASFSRFADILEAFAVDLKKPVTVEAVAMGVAGPVVDDVATLTNVGGMQVAAGEVGARFGARRARLLNDLEAMASSIEVLAADELLSLQDGNPHHNGSRAVIAAAPE